MCRGKLLKAALLVAAQLQAAAWGVRRLEPWQEVVMCRGAHRAVLWVVAQEVAWGAHWVASR